MKTYATKVGKPEETMKRNKKGKEDKDEIEDEEIIHAVSFMKNNKSPDEDNNLIEI